MEIIRFAEFDEICRDIEELKKSIPQLIEERDELLFTVCKNIEAKYMAAIGALEYKVFEAECYCRRLKRKAELIRARLNRQEKVDIKDIDRQLDLEMTEYTKLLDEKMQSLNNALSRLRGNVLSDDEATELKALYKIAVKQLHPDLNPDLPKPKKDLFLKAVEAYKNADLNTLRLICEAIDGIITDTTEDSYAELIKRRDLLFASMNKIRSEIEQIKARYPYTMKDFVENEAEIREKRRELDCALCEYKKMSDMLNEKIKEMI